MRRIFLVVMMMIPFTLLMTINGCSSSRIMVDYDKAADFSELKSFKVAASDGPVLGGPADPRQLLRQFMTEQIRANLEARDYVYREFGKADFMVRFYVNVKDKIDVDRYGYRYWSSGRGVRSTHIVNIDKYKQGTLVVDIIETNSRQLVWRGWKQTEVGRNRPGKGSPAEVRRVAEKAIRAILGEFPPGKAIH